MGLARGGILGLHGCRDVRHMDGPTLENRSARKRPERKRSRRMVDALSDTGGLPRFDEPVMDPDGLQRLADNPLNIRAVRLGEAGSRRDDRVKYLRLVGRR